MASYRVLRGIDYPPNKRVEAGQVATDLPATAIAWLLEDGAIEDASKPAKKIEEPKVEAPKVEEVIETPVVEVTPAVEETPAPEDEEI
jgi:hypothetical protein